MTILQSTPDAIIVKNLSCSHTVGLDAWTRSKLQPISITVTAYQNIHSAAKTDNLAHSTNYGTLAKAVQQFVTNSTDSGVGEDNTATCYTMEQLVDGIAQHCLLHFDISSIHVQVSKQKGLLFGTGATMEGRRVSGDFGSPLSREYKLSLQQMTIPAILGINPWERKQKQRVMVTLNATFRASCGSANEGEEQKQTAEAVQVDYLTLAQVVYEFVEKSSFKTVEALASHIAQTCLDTFDMDTIVVKVEKPSALTYADAAGVEVTRSASWWNSVKNKICAHDASHQLCGEDVMQSKVVNKFRDDACHTVFLSLGSNMGQRAQNLSAALKWINESEHSLVVDTSFLYETSPMYYDNQSPFLNAACKVLTKLNPPRFLQFCQMVEDRLGRKRNAERNGPRTVDLDILYFDDAEVSSHALDIPHPRLHERKFVLLPLNEYVFLENDAQIGLNNPFTTV
jgi:dihydroneopterin aldolase/2-amino-4-hydroxy-6-hydroxymethyldihydropteridine diphosphokinase/dihydropteroate synthase/2-amino-4-hydroxy-6-hydroxymethyldihydropteridine diphosphokinase/dihydropteroate synthase